MVSKLLNKVFGSRNERVLKRLYKVVGQINALEPTLQALDDGELAAKTPTLKARAREGTALDVLLPEAFAVVREAGVRTLGMRHFDVQLIGGMVLHDGKIAEMRTGEGKTLVATLAVYLNALAEKGVHVVTVNDYLARRDAQWMGQLYHFLGLSVGVINGSGGLGPDNSSFCFDPEFTPLEGEPGHSRLRPCTRKEAYACDVVYGTNNEFGFDYLRDNMAFSPEARVQGARNFAVVDEVDSILIDEARTPLIISGPAEGSAELYQKIDVLVPGLVRQQEEEGPGDYSVDEKHKQVFLTEEGHQKVEELMVEKGLLPEGDSLYDPAHLTLFHHLNACLRAHALFHRDQEYIVRQGQVVIVDEFTGRTMPGRRWSDGLHQAIEAKERVAIQPENQTMASITFQNYFRLYDKLSGMTGTADTEAYVFPQINGLEVVVIPTHKPMVRDDRGDLVYLSVEEKFDALVEDIRDCHQRGQPVLVGTTSIEVSELLAKRLAKEKVSHQVLNAKQHEREAEIIAQAGRPGSVTIATNMAGRGTDIVLGGNLQAELDALGPDLDEAEKQKVREAWQQRHDQVIQAGGLHIVGTERHESRRIDNQLGGRAGRQGDPGSSRFYLSLKDNLMRIFASERVSGLMQRLGMEKGEAIEHPWVTRAIENAQRKVEAHNFDMRKNLLEFDDVANEQRKFIYAQREELMEVEDVTETLTEWRSEVVNGTISRFIPPQSLEEQWDVPGLEVALAKDFALELPIQHWLEEEQELHEEPLRERILDALEKAYANKEELVGPTAMRYLEKRIVLDVLDGHWKEHLAAMDYLRQGIHLRGYAQKNPKQEYKREAFEMFQGLLERIRFDVVSLLARVQLQTQAPPQVAPRPTPQLDKLAFQHQEAPDLLAAEAEAEVATEAPVRAAVAGAGTLRRPAPNPRSAAAAAPADSGTPFVRDRKIGRNEPCPCGSGRKYKHCHGRLE
ncbi:MAG: preprotein translocase subunit SecA [Candidatus Competibacterales bacterium]